MIEIGTSLSQYRSRAPSYGANHLMWIRLLFPLYIIFIVIVIIVISEHSVRFSTLIDTCRNTCQASLVEDVPHSVKCVGNQLQI